MRVARASAAAGASTRSPGRASATATPSSIAPDLDDVDRPTTDLVIPGPEAALVAGVADECAAAGVAVLRADRRSTPRLESSKGFARELADVARDPRPGVRPLRRPATPTAPLAWWRQLGRPVVVKLDGLAAGKGVIVPADDAETEAAIRDAAELGPFVLEERLTGPECSLLALCDGTHRRARCRSPRTTSASARATPARTPAAWAPTRRRRSRTTPTSCWPRSSSRSLDYYAAAGTPYVGVLYAGLMLTPDGPAPDRVQLPLRRPRDPGRAAAAAQPTSPSWRWPRTRGDITARAARRSTPGAACTVVAAAAGLPGGAPRR